MNMMCYHTLPFSERINIIINIIRCKLETSRETDWNDASLKLIRINFLTVYACKKQCESNNSPYKKSCRAYVVAHKYQIWMSNILKHL